MVEVYQLKGHIDPEIREYGMFEFFGMVDGPDPKNYVKVWEGELGTSELETIYGRLRLNAPEDYHGGELDKSDVVVVDGNAYFLDGDGFAEVEFDTSEIKRAIYEPYGYEVVTDGAVQMPGELVEVCKALDVPLGYEGLMDYHGSRKGESRFSAAPSSHSETCWLHPSFLRGAEAQAFVELLKELTRAENRQEIIDYLSAKRPVYALDLEEARVKFRREVARSTPRNTVSLPIHAVCVNTDRYSRGEYLPMRLALPTTKEAVRAFIQELGVDAYTLHNFSVRYCECAIESLENALPMGASPGETPGMMLDELNYLAAKIWDMDEYERTVFERVLAAGRHCGSVSEIINITENLNCCYVDTMLNETMLGKRMLERDAERYAAEFEKIYNSDDEDLSEVMDYIKLLEEYFDAEAYGKVCAKGENGVFTELGYLTEDGIFSEVYRGAADIPEEYRVLAPALQEPLVKVEDVDLGAMLLAMRAVVGEFERDALHNLAVLADGGEQYFVAARGKLLSVVREVEAYHKNSFGNGFLSGAADTATVFKFSVTDSEDGRVTGNICELDVAALQADIRERSIDFTYAGEEERLAARLRGGQQAVTENGKFAAVTIAPKEFLAKINAEYMAAAENSRTDLVRLSPDAAREILARGDAEVLRLVPNGTEPLTAIDAVKNGLNVAAHREFAIRRADLPGLEKWASRSAETILRAVARGERTAELARGTEEAL